MYLQYKLTFVAILQYKYKLKIRTHFFTLNQMQNVVYSSKCKNCLNSNIEIRNSTKQNSNYNVSICIGKGSPLNFKGRKIFSSQIIVAD